MIRGENNLFTVYSRGKSTCTEAGSDYDIFQVGISSGEWDPISGDIQNTSYLAVTIDVDGTLSQACAARIAGSAELTGEWSVFEFIRDQFVEPSSLVYMCVDDITINFNPSTYQIWLD